MTPFIPDNAPFTNAQIAWLNGFLAGMFSAAQTNPQTEPQPARGLPLTVLYGSETGNTAALAKATARKASEAGFSVTLSCMSKYDPARLGEETHMLVLTSTYGDGEPPASAVDLYNFLHSESAPEVPKLRFSVLALGDSNYPDFCKCGKDFDMRFEQLGGTRLVDRRDCDTDYEEPYEQWLNEALASLGSSALSGTAKETPTETGYDKKHPFPARIVDNRNLNTPESSKETRHIAISLDGSGLSYLPGDALGVYPRNDPGKVAEILNLLGFDPECLVEGKQLSQLLETDYDVTRLTLPYVETYTKYCQHPDLLKLLSLPREDQLEFCWGREIIDLLENWTPTFSGPEEFLASLKKMSPRLYSISSSPRAHPGEVHLTVGTVRYQSHGRNRGGVCSTYLADRCGDNPLPVFIHSNENFRLPDDGSRPVIMIGPGTGIAPFRAFLEEREATGARGENWLFFGDRHATSDFLYQDQLKQLQAKGTLTRLITAFSRDQEEKIYVQDRMREYGESLHGLIEKGAYIYVCGDASRMAKDVDLALREIIATHGAVSPEEAEKRIGSLKAERRYCRDVY